MDTLITIQGFFYTKIPFTLANAEAVRRGSIRGIILSQGGNEATILRTRLLSSYSIAAVVRTNNEDVVLAINEKGFDANGFQYFIYEKTDYPTYQHFSPDPYQACLIRLRFDTCEEAWHIAVCDGYNDKNPTFFDNDHDFIYDCLPLDLETQPMIGKTISWKKFVTERINDSEILF